MSVTNMRSSVAGSGGIARRGGYARAPGKSIGSGARKPQDCHFAQRRVLSLAMQPLNIAHRGGAGLMPENTLAAFRDAVARGCDGAELDVQLTRDGVAVVHHDFRLMADVARRDGAWLTVPGPRIKDLTLEELRAFDVGAAKAGQRLCVAPSRSAEGRWRCAGANPGRGDARAGRRPLRRASLLFVEFKCDLPAQTAPIRWRWRMRPMEVIAGGIAGQADLRRLRLAGPGADPPAKSGQRPAGSPPTNCSAMHGR